MEEFPHLLSKSTQNLILHSLHNATKGDEYRFGHLDKTKDNLYPSYSNPVSTSNSGVPLSVCALTTVDCSPLCVPLFLVGPAVA